MTDSVEENDSVDLILRHVSHRFPEDLARGLLGVDGGPRGSGSARPRSPKCGKNDVTQGAGDAELDTQGRVGGRSAEGP